MSQQHLSLLQYLRNIKTRIKAERAQTPLNPVSIYTVNKLKGKSKLISVPFHQKLTLATSQTGTDCMSTAQKAVCTRESDHQIVRQSRQNQRTVQRRKDYKSEEKPKERGSTDFATNTPVQLSTLVLPSLNLGEKRQRTKSGLSQVNKSVGVAVGQGGIPKRKFSYQAQMPGEDYIIYNLAIKLYSQCLDEKQNLRNFVLMVVQKLRLFRHLGSKLSKALINSAKTLVFKEKKVLVKRGEVMTSIYVVLEGTVSAVGQEETALLRSGSVIGLSFPIRWQQNLIAECELLAHRRTVLLRVTRDNLFKFLVRVKCDSVELYREVNAVLREESGCYM